MTEHPTTPLPATSLSATTPSTSQLPATAPEVPAIVVEEDACVHRVRAHLDEARQQAAAPRATGTYDASILELREEMSSARPEDLPPLIEQLDRLQSLASRRPVPSEMPQVDPMNPYFGRMVLKEGNREREVLIGRTTYLATHAGIRIVDWRDAPVSRLYYRYDEGDDYAEVFGDREIEGEVLVRRSVSIKDGSLRRVIAPGGSYQRRPSGEWLFQESSASRLSGGQGSATRADRFHKPGTLGVGSSAEERPDHHLREITALIDPKQFEIITRVDSGLVVIQGGAGSGKTTIGLHRLAYLSFLAPQRFRAERMLVVVFNDALARYISLVLPALDLPGVPIVTYLGWCRKLRRSHFPRLPDVPADDTPNAVTRFKRHPLLLRAIDQIVAQRARQCEAQTAEGLNAEDRVRWSALWQQERSRPLLHVAVALEQAMQKEFPDVPHNVKVRIVQLLERLQADCREGVTLWGELLTQRALLDDLFAEEFSGPERDAIHAYCSKQVAEVQGLLERQDEQALGHDEDDEDDALPKRGIDGAELTEEPKLDAEDDSVLLRIWQRFRGQLLAPGKEREVIVYDHILVDETQDMSPLELAILLETARNGSVTLAGDVAQKLHMDNGFADWSTTFDQLGMSQVAIEPLRVSYRSTVEIIELAQHVLGPWAPADAPVAQRHGAPVEAFGFGDTGEAVAFLSDSLRHLVHREPHASIAVIARYPEQAALYYQGLKAAEVPFVRLIAAQDFPFTAGIDVTDVRQVKGLEFDYVILVEVGEPSYPDRREARHLLHIAATRAAHQLWVLSTGRPSPLLPESMQELLE